MALEDKIRSQGGGSVRLRWYTRVCRKGSRRWRHDGSASSYACNFSVSVVASDSGVKTAYHAETVLIVKAAFTIRAVVLPVAFGFHVLFGRLLGAKLQVAGLTG